MHLPHDQPRVTELRHGSDRLGILGLAAFALPPAFRMVSVRQYISHTSKSVQEIRRHNTDLQAIARWSHERLDGKGYPDGFAGDAIPEPARIVLVADAFDALTTNRVYRPGRTAALALEEIRAHVGTQFCGRVVAELEALYREAPEAFTTEEDLAGVA